MEKKEITDTDEVICAIREAGKQMCKDYLRDYRKIKKRSKAFEKRRPSLIRKLGVATIDSGEEYEPPSDDKLAALSPKDCTEMEAYLDNRFKLYMVDLVISERLNTTDAAIIRDMLDNGISTEEAAVKHGYSYITGRRARVHLREAFADEALLDFQLGALMENAVGLDDETLSSIQRKMIQKSLWNDTNPAT